MPAAYGVPAKIIGVVRSLYVDTHIRVRVDWFFSRPVAVRSVVRQEVPGGRHRLAGTYGHYLCQDYGHAPAALADACAQPSDLAWRLTALSDLAWRLTALSDLAWRRPEESGYGVGPESELRQDQGRALHVPHQRSGGVWLAYLIGSALCNSDSANF
eukprot:350899-Chlamydomonas_euryale.AAC.5